MEPMFYFFWLPYHRLPGDFIFLYPEEQTDTELRKIAANLRETKPRNCQVRDNGLSLIVKSIKFIANFSSLNWTIFNNQEITIFSML